MITVIAAVSVTLLGAIMAPFETWHMPSRGEFALLAICGLTVLMGYVFIIIASRSGDAAACAPFRYAYIVFALLSSLLVFHESSDTSSWIGIALIVGSGLYMLHRERVVGTRPAASVSINAVKQT
jgi:drug/metabolite transporter (DMT)-like permease